MSENTEDKAIVPLFHQRFSIEVGLDEARQRFVNRVANGIQAMFPLLNSEHYKDRKQDITLNRVASTLGRRYASTDTFSWYCGYDFAETLRCVEALHRAFGSSPEQAILGAEVRLALHDSEVDIGVEWRDGIFWPKGAKLLDQALVNEPLEWMSEPTYKSVLQPFKKALSDYLESTAKPERLTDVITDMYEALEAMAKIVTGNDREMSGNRELFISRISLDKHYAKMLKDYIGYANEYRHAVALGQTKKPPSEHETEAFMYMTGLFIRLAIKQFETRV